MVSEVSLPFPVIPFPFLSPRNLASSHFPRARHLSELRGLFQPSEGALVTRLPGDPQALGGLLGHLPSSCYYSFTDS